MWSNEVIKIRKPVEAERKKENEEGKRGLLTRKGCAGSRERERVASVVEKKRGQKLRLIITKCQ